jgi:ferredoxin-type protein NapG
MSKGPISNQSPESRSDRRQFFLRGLGKTLQGLLAAVEKASPVPWAAIAAGSPRLVVRPPHALAEDDFLKTCYRCGSCVDACLPHALTPLQDNDEALSGTPYLDFDFRACELCQELPCVQACPSGALKPSPRVSVESPEDPSAGPAAPLPLWEIRLGLAAWDERHCLRSQGQACQACIEKCPVGLMTLHLSGRGQIEVLANQCVGCGTCQLVCPARPKALHILPL